MSVDLRSLMGRLSPTSRRALEGAAGLAMSRTHYEVEIEHWFEKLLEDPLFEAPDLLRPAGGRVTVDREFVDRKLQDLLSDTEQSAYIL